MKLLPFSFVFVLLLLGTACTPPATPMDLSQEHLIPKPVSLTATGSSFALTDRTNIYVQDGGEEGLAVGRLLSDYLTPATGFNIEVQSTDQSPASGNILLSVHTSKDEELGEEGYELTITEERVKVSANTAQGLFRAIQTIRQLLPAEIEANSQQQGPWEIASGTIRDYPRHGYRGSMLDVARHFFGVEDVKRYIDFIATYKMNHLHLHLSDDQGWRIEIKSWPKLAEYGGSTEVGGGPGGYYTQEQYKELVQYAAARYITIIPEIDMPGHTNAALAAYPELNCNGKTPKLYTGIEVGFSSLCTDRELVYKFVDDVMGELAAITPGPYIHVGGDETHSTKMEDYIPFVNRVQEIVAKHGKQVMGWDEISNAQIAPNTVVQYWKFRENALAAIAQKGKVLMSPAHKSYMDMQYDSTSRLGLHWAAYIEVDEAYDWDPETLEEGVTKEHIIGIETPLWSETVTNMDDIEYLVFPRLPGYAEIGWTPPGLRNWDDYKVRLGKQQSRFEIMEIDYYPSARVPWSKE